MIQNRAPEQRAPSKKGVVLTLNDVPQALGQQQVSEPRHLVLQLPHQPVVGVLVDHSVAADLLGPVRVPVGGGGGVQVGGRLAWCQLLAWR